jgi:hypothetical protein
VRVVALSAGVALGVWVAACSPQRSHLFGAQHYDPDHDCLEKGAAVDVIEGPDPGTCDVLHCWVAPSEDVYVTTTACDAPPGYVDHTADPAGTPCARALAAHNRPDGGCP